MHSSAAVFLAPAGSAASLAPVALGIGAPDDDGDDAYRRRPLTTVSAATAFAAGPPFRCRWRLAAWRWRA